MSVYACVVGKVCACLLMFILKHMYVSMCVCVHAPACVFTPAALQRFRECQEAVKAEGAWGA